MGAEEKYPLLIGHSLAGRTRLHNIQEVANFICVHGQYGDLTIMQEDGTPLLDTIDIYVNKIADMEYREALLKVLIPMQREVEYQCFENDESETDEEDIKIEMEMQAMNRFEAERRFVQRIKDSYPPGTRIILLSMGNDPRPVEAGTRGTVKAVDDLGTLHCSFDNGRQLGVVPGEDSFRKLTDEELAEEQNESMDEGNAPVMGM